MENSIQDPLSSITSEVQEQDTAILQPAKKQPDYSLPAEDGLVVGIKKTLVAFSERFTNFFSSSGRARNLLGKPTEDLTTALKLISKLNKKLEGTPFDKITFANFHSYIEAIQCGEVLQDGKRVNPADIKNFTKKSFTTEELQELSVGFDLKEIAKNQTTDKTKKATTQLFKTAEKAINAWQKAIVDAGKDLKHNSFTALVKAATNVALETYKKTHSLDENSEEFQEMKTFLEKESGKIWAKFSPDKYVQELADKLEQELDFAKKYIAQVDVDPNQKTEAILTSIKNNLLELDRKIEEQALLQTKYLGGNFADHKDQIKAKLNENPQFQKARARMDTILRELEAKHGNFSSISSPLISQMLVNHNSIVQAGKISNPENRGEAHIAQVFEVSNNINNYLEALESLDEIADSSKPAAYVQERARFYNAAIKKAEENITTLFAGNKDAAATSHRIMTEATKTRNALGLIQNNKTPMLKPKTSQTPAITQELRDFLRSQIKDLLGDSPKTASPTVLRTLLLAIENEENGLENVFGQNHSLLFPISSLFNVGTRLDDPDTQLYTFANDEAAQAIFNALEGQGYLTTLQPTLIDVPEISTGSSFFSEMVKDPEEAKVLTEEEQQLLNARLRSEIKDILGEDITTELIHDTKARSFDAATSEEVSEAKKSLEKDRFTNLFSEAGRARNVLGKPAEDLTEALSLIQELNNELKTTKFDRVTFANFKEYIEAIQEGKVLVGGVAIAPQKLFINEDKTTYSPEEARQVFIVQNLQQAINNRVKDESPKGIAELSTSATKAISFWKTAMINAGKELDDDHSSSLMHAAIEEVTGKYQQEHKLDGQAPALTEMKTFLEGEAKQIWAKESTEKYIKELAEEFDFLHSSLEEQYRSILQGNPLERDLMIEELEELLQTINLTLAKVNSELLTQAKLYGSSLGKDVFKYRTEMIQKLNQQKKFTEALAKMDTTLTAIETKLKTLSPNSKALLGQIVTNHAVVRGAAKKSNPDFKGEANVARVFKANNNLDANVKAFNALEVVDGTLPARDIAERAHFYSQAINEAQEQIDTLFEGNQEATSAHRSAQHQAALSRETLNHFKVDNQPAISDGPLQSPPITEELALPLLEHIDNLLGDRYENASPTLLRQLLIAIENEENGLQNVFGNEGALLIQIPLTETSINSLFTEGEKLGTKETFAQLYTISEENYDAIKEAVELKKFENSDLGFLEKNISNPQLIRDKLMELEKNGRINKIFSEKEIKLLGPVQDLFELEGGNYIFALGCQSKLEYIINKAKTNTLEQKGITLANDNLEVPITLSNTTRKNSGIDDPNLIFDGLNDSLDEQQPSKESSSSIGTPKNDQVPTDEELEDRLDRLRKT